MSSHKSKSLVKTTEASGTSQIDSIAELEQEKERLVSEGKYLEANEIKKKLAALRANKQNKAKQNIYDNQEKQSEKLAELYTEEYNNLIQNWDTQIQNFIEKYEENEKKLTQEHAKQMSEYVQDLMSKYPTLKYSKEYLENKAIEVNLAKQERFKEAEQFRKKCDKLEQKEMENYNKQRKITIQKKAETLGLKQENEKKNLSEKFEIKLELMKKEKDKDIEKLELKYKNLKNELDYVYKYENFASEKKLSQSKSLRGNSTMRRMNNIMEKTERLNSVAEQDNLQENINEAEQNAEEGENKEEDNKE